MNSTDLSVVDPLVACDGKIVIDGFISSRLMAAYHLDGGHVIHVSRAEPEHGLSLHRQTWQYVLERSGVTIFEGTDFSTMAGTTYGEAARGVLGFLTLCEGDTDAEYFDSYTPDQLAWRDECAEELGIFGMED